METLRAYIVCPSRYDDGEVVTFRLGMVPNGALGALAGLAEDYNRRHEGTRQIDYEFYDEFVRKAITADMLRQWRDEAEAKGQRFLLMLCGVQSVSFPRARDLALMAKRDGIDVIAGGVHLSAHGPSVDFLVSCGIPVAIGEAEMIWDEIITDAFERRLQPIYRMRSDQGVKVKSATSYITAPDIDVTPYPHIPIPAQKYYINPRQLFVESSRGCPFLCTFCVVKNVFGRTVRSRDPKRLVEWMVERVTQDGTTGFTLTDDNFVRNPRHMEVLEHVAAARARGIDFSILLVMDVEATCYVDEDSPRGEKTRRFLQLCKDAGVAWVFMGLESTNDAVLQEMRKGVNRDREDVHSSAALDATAARQRLIRRYQTATRAWHDIGVSVECGAIMGFNADQKGVGRQMLNDFMEIGIDIVHFYQVAPLPGSEDYARAVRDGTLLQNDFNQFLREDPMIAHPTMTGPELRHEILTAIRGSWSLRNVLRRIAGGTFGIGRTRSKEPFDYAKKQIAYKIALATSLTSHIAGGLFRRGKEWSAPREVISNEEARRYYLGATSAARTNTASETMRDGSTMESLPILNNHDLGQAARPVIASYGDEVPALRQAS